jgi:hypothetical protein
MGRETRTADSVRSSGSTNEEGGPSLSIWTASSDTGRKEMESRYESGELLLEATDGLLKHPLKPLVSQKA